MQASVVIPVWNGAAVIADCLAALYEQANSELLEVICVDNNSADDSAEIVARSCPQARLVRQPANLGFAGGINAGVEAAQGDLLVLLNQDCVVQAGWLPALHAALDDCPQAGIAGCTILNADGSVNHTGAEIRRPAAYGQHRTDVERTDPEAMPFVTGAAMAIRRATWQAVGPFDEGYYPGYYEDSDYCFRARRLGIETLHVPGARVMHLFSSQELQRDPVRYMTWQHRGRYRFVAKHWTSAEVGAFFEAEEGDVAAEENLHHALARMLAARQVAGKLDEILESRSRDLRQASDAGRWRQLHEGLLAVARHSFQVAEELTQVSLFAPPVSAWAAANAELEGRLLASPDPFGPWHDARERLRMLTQQEQDLLDRIYLSRQEGRPRSVLQRLLGRWLLSPLIRRRDYLLRSDLSALYSARLDLLSEMVDAALAEIVRSQNRRIAEVNGLYRQRVEQTESLLHHSHEELSRRLALLESLAEHDQP
jgi:GT2 family glycosyltransferase